MFTSSSTSTRGGYLQRDVGLFGPRLPAESLERLWTMLSHSQGGLLKASRLATRRGVSSKTGKRYTHLLADLFLGPHLPANRTKVGKRQVNTQEGYVGYDGHRPTQPGSP